MSNKMTSIPLVKLCEDDFWPCSTKACNVWFAFLFVSEWQRNADWSCFNFFAWESPPCEPWKQLSTVHDWQQDDIRSCDQPLADALQPCSTDACNVWIAFVFTSEQKKMADWSCWLFFTLNPPPFTLKTSGPCSWGMQHSAFSKLWKDVHQPCLTRSCNVWLWFALLSESQQNADCWWLHFTQTFQPSHPKTSCHCCLWATRWLPFLWPSFVKTISNHTWQTLAMFDLVLLPWVSDNRMRTGLGCISSPGNLSLVTLKTSCHCSWGTTWQPFLWPSFVNMLSNHTQQMLARFDLVLLSSVSDRRMQTGADGCISSSGTPPVTLKTSCQCWWHGQQGDFHCFHHALSTCFSTMLDKCWQWPLFDSVLLSWVSDRRLQIGDGCISSPGNVLPVTLKTSCQHWWATRRHLCFFQALSRCVATMLDTGNVSFAFALMSEW